ncbi:MAG: hypothetical protein M3R27_11835 [Bacteroidota bacterium]|nr:hypothetical protein [Bacteroidota bacterium]
MKKPDNVKKGVVKKPAEKGKESGELRKPTKLKPLKEKEKKNWKNNLEEEDEDFSVEDDIGLDDSFADDEEDDYFDDKF